MTISDIGCLFVWRKEAPARLKKVKSRDAGAGNSAAAPHASAARDKAKIAAKAQQRNSATN